MPAQLSPLPPVLSSASLAFSASSSDPPVPPDFDALQPARTKAAPQSSAVAMTRFAIFALPRRPMLDVHVKTAPGEADSQAGI
jgi:hypothetical protein